MAKADLVGAAERGFERGYSNIARTAELITDWAHETEAKKVGEAYAKGEEEISASFGTEIEKTQAELASVPPDSEQSFALRGRLISLSAQRDQARLSLMNQTYGAYASNPYVAKAAGQIGKQLTASIQANANQMRDIQELAQERGEAETRRVERLDKSLGRVAEVVFNQLPMDESGRRIVDEQTMQAATQRLEEVLRNDPSFAPFLEGKSPEEQDALLRQWGSRVGNDVRALGQRDQAEGRQGVAAAVAQREWDKANDPTFGRFAPTRGSSDTSAELAVDAYKAADAQLGITKVSGQLIGPDGRPPSPELMAERDRIAAGYGAQVAAPRGGAPTGGQRDLGGEGEEDISPPPALLEAAKKAGKTYIGVQGDSFVFEDEKGRRSKVRMTQPAEREEAPPAQPASSSEVEDPRSKPAPKKRNLEMEITAAINDPSTPPELRKQLEAKLRKLNSAKQQEEIQAIDNWFRLLVVGDGSATAKAKSRAEELLAEEDE